MYRCVSQSPSKVNACVKASSFVWILSLGVSRIGLIILISNYLNVCWLFWFKKKEIEQWKSRKKWKSRADNGARAIRRAFFPIFYCFHPRNARTANTLWIKYVRKFVVRQLKCYLSTLQWLDSQFSWSYTVLMGSREPLMSSIFLDRFFFLQKTNITSST